MQEKRIIEKQDSLGTIPNVKYYRPIWKSKGIDLANSKNLTNKQNIWLIFEDDRGLGTIIGACLEKRHQKVIYIKIKEDCQECFLDNNKIELNPYDERSYSELVKVLLSKKLMPNYILFFWGCIEDSANITIDSFNKLQYLSVYSLFFLDKHFFSKTLQNILFVSFSVTQFNITGMENINTQMSPMLGVTKVIPTENHHIHTLHIDLKETLNEISCECILVKICSIETPLFEVCALRKGEILTQSYEEISTINNKNSSKRIFINNGVYLITGGLGGLGLAFARHIATKANATIILVSRREFPERKDWSTLPELSIKEKNIIAKINAIELLGSKICLYRCDISDSKEVESLFAEIFHNFSHLNGIIHAAGIAAQHIQYEKNVNSIKEVLSPKLFGTLNLMKYSKNFRIDFMALCSSLDSVVGAIGSIEYCAANAYLDVVAQLGSLTHIGKILAINWNTISDTGMAVDFISSFGGKISQNTISSTMASSILEESIGSNLNRLVISLALPLCLL